MIDSHCHLDLPSFEHDLDRVLKNARANGVTRFLIPGTTELGWQRQYHIADNNPDVDIALGLHPYFFNQDLGENNSVLAALERELLQPHHAVVAIGETGIDGHIELCESVQFEFLCAHLELAKKKALPVILHHRKSHHVIFQALKQTKFNNGGVIHAFSGSVEVARSYIDAGFMLGIGGTVTYPRGNKTRQAIKPLGLAHLLLETDAPDMPMFGRQGQRNAPQYLGEVVNVLAELFSITQQDVIKQTSHNYFSVFRRRFIG